jgi:tetratricopeptide (TPR) repeat protein/predicted Ser/Thr protein kinase
MLGQILQNRYRIEEELGKGGMGVVYRAYDITLGRDVALKVVSDNGLGAQGQMRLLSEAKATARLNHNNIVTVYDAGEAGAQPFIVMELVVGESLRERGLDLSQALNYCAQVCDALESAHQHGIIHRDLKPENVLVTESGVAKLMDFGLAHHADGPHLTGDGDIVGTITYLAPELLMGGQPSVQSDLYALGVMLYQFATGRPLFEGGDLIQQLTQHLHVSVVPPSTHNPEIPASLETLILRLLAKKPKDRPASAAEVGDTLRALTQETVDSGLYRLPDNPVLLLNRVVRGRLVTREREMAEISSHWQRTVAGQSGLVLVAGEPGIGKTRLVTELMTRVELERGYAFLGACYAEGNAPYGPFAQIIPELLQSLPSELVETSLNDVVRAELVQLVPSLAARFPGAQANPQIDLQAGQLRAFDCVTQLLSLAASQKPLLLVLDDVHWADSGSLALIRHILRRRSLRILVVMAYRETDLSEMRALNEILSELGRDDGTLRIKLTRLNREQTEELLASMFAEAVSPDFLDVIYRETEGNPFFVEEICKALIDSGQLTRAAGRWQRPSAGDIRVPQNVRTAIESRLSRMPENVQDVLRQASIFGREFEFATLLGLTGQTEDDLIDALEYAEHAQLIYELKDRREGMSGPDVCFAFTHALIPSSIQDGISTLRRQRMHRKALSALMDVRPDAYDRLAYHASQGGDEVRAGEYFFLAGKNALARFAMREAIENLQQAAELEVEPSRQAEIWAGLGEAEFRTGKGKEGIAHLERAIESYLQQECYDKAASTLSLQIHAIWFSLSANQAVETASQWVERVSSWPDGLGVARLCHEIGRVFILAGRESDGLRLIERASSIASRENMLNLELHIEATHFLFKKSDLERITRVEAVIARAEQQDFIGDGLTRAFNNAAIVYYRLARFRDALTAQQKMYAVARKMGTREQELWSLATIGRFQTYLGHLDESGQTFAEMKSLLQSVNLPVLDAMYRGFEPLYRLMWMDPQTTLLDFQASYQRAVESSNLQELEISGGQYAEALLLAGEFEQACEPIAGALQTAIQREDVGHQFWLSALQVWALFETRKGHAEWEKESVECRANLQKLLPETLEPLANLYRLFYLAWESALRNDFAQAVTFFQQYAESEERAGRPWYCARGLSMAARFAKDSDPILARYLYQETLNTYQNIGATWYSQNVLRLIEEIDRASS